MVWRQIVSTPPTELLDEIVAPEETRPHLQAIAEHCAQAIAKVLAKIRNRGVSHASCVRSKSLGTQMIHHELRPLARSAIHSLHRRHGAKNEELPCSRWYIPSKGAVWLHVFGQVD